MAQTALASTGSAAALLHFGEERHHFFVTACRWSPFYLNGLGFLANETVVEGFQADIDSGEWRFEGCQINRIG